MNDRHLPGHVLVVLVSSLMAVGSQPAAADPAPTTFDYVVKQGDSCLGIAVNVLGGRAQLAKIHELNPDLGPTPHVLRAGQILKLPAAGRPAPDAKVAQAHNVVELRRAGEARWNPALIGAELFRAWRVGARERSSAKIVFTDTSTIEMRENTVVVIYGAQATARAPRQATLETGALRSRLGELDGRPVEVATPSAQVGLSPGSAVVEVARTGATLVSNHRGKPAQFGAKRGTARRTKVDPGFGVDVQRDQAPSKPRPLPPAPAWRSPPGLAIGWTTDGAALTASWDPVATAARYRFELADDRGALLLQLELPATASSIELHRLPAGRFLLSLATVDTTGLEGPQSTTPPVLAALLHLAGDKDAPLGDIASDPPRSPARLRMVPLGTPIEAPEGTTCTANGKPALVSAGVGAIRCEAAGATAELAVEVARVTVERPSQATALREHEAAQVTIMMVADVAPVGELVAIGDAHVRVLGTTPIGGGVRVRVEATSVGHGVVTLAVRGPAGDTVLGTATIEVAPTSGPDLSTAAARARSRSWIDATLGLTRNTAQLAPQAGIHFGLGIVPHLAMMGGLDASSGRELPALARLGVATPVSLGGVIVEARFGGAVTFEGRTGGFAGLAARIPLGGGWSLTAGAGGVLLDGPERLECALGVASRL